MPETTIDIATDGPRIEAVKTLCREFVDWQLDEFPHLRTSILTYFEPAKWESVLADLPNIHARPTGAMLLACSEGKPVGCIMYRRMAPGIAEVKRLFVTPAARGSGIGRSLVEAMLASAARDGYRLARLDTAKFLTGAIALYGRAGFRETAPFGDAPPGVTDVAVFMERPIQPVPTAVSESSSPV